MSKIHQKGNLFISKKNKRQMQKCRKKEKEKNTKNTNETESNYRKRCLPK